MKKALLVLVLIYLLRQLLPPVIQIVHNMSKLKLMLISVIV